MSNFFSTDFITNLNAFVCLVIFLRVVTFKREGKQFNLWNAFIAYAIAVCAGSIALYIALGFYEGTTDTRELILNIVIMLALLKSKGNTSSLNLLHLYDSSKPFKANLVLQIQRIKHVVTRFFHSLRS